MTLGPKVRRYVRYAEAAVVVALLGWASITYRELSALRKQPVALPTYDFEVSEGRDTVKAHGTWTSDGGIPGALGTTSIECMRSSMRCVESTAEVVFLSGRGLLESRMAQFEIATWADNEIVAKPYALRCTTRTLALDLAKKRAHSRSSPNPDVSLCEEQPARSYELVAGYAARRE
jgi:hypothetical protein